MKKWMSTILIVGLTAGVVSAAWWPFGSDKKEEEKPPAVEQPRGTRSEAKHGRSSGARQRQKPTEGEQRAKMEKMRAERMATHKLAEAARNETDPVKKEQLIGQLREKLTAGADKMQAEFRKRLKKAEAEVGKMQARLADAETNREQRVEESLQKLLAGEPLERPKGKRQGGAEFRKPGKASE